MAYTGASTGKSTGASTGKSTGKSTGGGSYLEPTPVVTINKNGATLFRTATAQEKRQYQVEQTMKKNKQGGKSKKRAYRQSRKIKKNRHKKRSKNITKKRR